jgi:hypothetical protein
MFSLWPLLFDTVCTKMAEIRPDVAARFRANEAALYAAVRVQLEADEARYIAEHGITRLEALMRKRAAAAAPLVASDAVPHPDLSALPTDTDYEKWGVQKRILANMMALRVLRWLQANPQQATGLDAVALRAYTGWGGIDVRTLPDEPDAFREDFYEALKSWKRAGKGGVVPPRIVGTDSQWFTPINVVQAATNLAEKVLNQTGITVGDVLEPSAGNGRFVRASAYPDALWTTIDADADLAAMMKFLHPDARVYSAYMEDWYKAAGNGETYDLIIGNPPYGDRPIPYRRVDMYGQLRAEDYFLDRCLSMLAPGGVLTFVTMQSMMVNPSHTEFRRSMLRRAHLVTAVAHPFPNVVVPTMTIVLVGRAVGDRTTRSLTNDEKLIVEGKYWGGVVGEHENVVGEWALGGVSGKQNVLKGKYSEDAVRNAKLSPMPDADLARAMAERGSVTPVVDGGPNEQPEFDENGDPIEDDGTVVTKEQFVGAYEPLTIVSTMTGHHRFRPLRQFAELEGAQQQRLALGASVEAIAAKFVERLRTYGKMRHVKPDLAEAGKYELMRDLQGFVARWDNPWEQAALVGEQTFYQPLFNAINQDGSVADAYVTDVAEPVNRTLPPDASVVEIIQHYTIEAGSCNEADLDHHRHGQPLTTEEVLALDPNIVVEFVQGAATYVMLESYRTGYLYPKLKAVEEALLGDPSPFVRERLNSQRETLITTIDAVSISQVKGLTPRSGYVGTQCIYDFIADRLGAVTDPNPRAVPPFSILVDAGRLTITLRDVHFEPGLSHGVLAEDWPGLGVKGAKVHKVLGAERCAFLYGFIGYFNHESMVARLDGVPAKRNSDANLRTYINFLVANKLTSVEQGPRLNGLTDAEQLAAIKKAAEDAEAAEQDQDVQEGEDGEEGEGGAEPTAPKSYFHEDEASGAKADNAMDAVTRLEFIFRDWLTKHDVHSVEVEAAYNRVSRGFRPPVYSTKPVLLARWTSNPKKQLREHQITGVRRLLDQGRGMFAWNVGYGKTMGGLATLAGWRQRGECKRPLILCPNNLVMTWWNEIHGVLPDYRVGLMGYTLVPNPETGKTLPVQDTPAMRQQKWIQFQKGTYDVLICPYSNFTDDVDVSDETKDRILGEFLWLQADIASTEEDLEIAKRALATMEVQLRHLRAELATTLAEKKQALVKKIDALDMKITAKKASIAEPKSGQIAQIIASLGKLVEGGTKEQANPLVMWETLGVDALIVDEVHNFKNLWGVGKRYGFQIAFMGAKAEESTTIRSWDLLIKCMEMQERTGGRNTLLLTGTPIKNSPMEVYNLLGYLGRNVWLNAAIPSSEAFVDAFCNIEALFNVSKTEDSAGFVPGVSGFKGLNELRQVLTMLMDRRMDALPDVIIPKGIKDDTLKVVEDDFQKQTRIVMIDIRDAMLNTLKIRESENPVVKELSAYGIGEVTKQALSATIDRATAGDEDAKSVVARFEASAQGVFALFFMTCLSQLATDPELMKEKVKDAPKNLVAKQAAAALAEQNLVIAEATIAKLLTQRTSRKKLTEAEKLQLQKAQDASKVNLRKQLSALLGVLIAEYWINLGNYALSKTPYTATNPPPKYVSVSNMIALDGLAYKREEPTAAQKARGEEGSLVYEKGKPVVTGSACGHLIFCDYKEYVHAKLRNQISRITGIPKERIALLSEANAGDRDLIAKKFNGTREGAIGPDGLVAATDVKPEFDIVIGTSAVMAEGLNLQMRTCSIHHITIPWEPATITQRNGRAVRQGNSHLTVKLRYYVAEKTFDSFKLNDVMGKKEWQETLYDEKADVANNPAAGDVIDRVEMVINATSRSDEEAAEKKTEVRAIMAERQAERETRKIEDAILQAQTAIRTYQVARNLDRLVPDTRWQGPPEERPLVPFDPIRARAERRNADGAVAFLQTLGEGVLPPIYVLALEKAPYQYVEAWGPLLVWDGAILRGSRARYDGSMAHREFMVRAPSTGLGFTVRELGSFEKATPKSLDRHGGLTWTISPESWDTATDIAECLDTVFVDLFGQHEDVSSLDSAQVQAVGADRILARFLQQGHSGLEIHLWWNGNPVNVAGFPMLNRATGHAVWITRSLYGKFYASNYQRYKDVIETLKRDYRLLLPQIPGDFEAYRTALHQGKIDLLDQSHIGVLKELPITDYSLTKVAMDLHNKAIGRWFKYDLRQKEFHDGQVAYDAPAKAAEKAVKDAAKDAAEAERLAKKAEREAKAAAAKAEKEAKKAANEAYRAQRRAEREAQGLAVEPEPEPEPEPEFAFEGEPDEYEALAGEAENS